MLSGLKYGTFTTLLLYFIFTAVASPNNISNGAEILIFIDFPLLTRSKKTISPLELIISVQESSLYSIIKICSWINSKDFSLKKVILSSFKFSLESPIITSNLLSISLESGSIVSLYGVIILLIFSS